jgi:phosphonoacetate hydrolase
MNHLELNGVTYAWPQQPIVVVCIDGGDPAYIEQGIKDGILPNIEKFMREGFSGIANGTVPSFTCPNNMSLITGAPPAVHGISGNYYLNEHGEAVVMTGPELLRSPTILATFANAGAKVVSITAKDKLRKQLGKGLDLARGNVSFSSEFASQCTVEENGIANVLELVGMPQPDMYSMDLSLFVLEAGIKLLEIDKPQLLFLSLTDYIQHKYAPGDDVANTFYKRLDDAFGRLAALGAVVALTADHGMNDKSQADGTPKVIYLQDFLDQEFGAGSSKVICPITDAFVRHHGALGGFVRIWLRDAQLSVQSIIDKVKTIEGVELALTREEVCKQFELPADREGDIAVIGDTGTVIGASAADHDLSNLTDARLRSHGAVAEAHVPFILNRPLKQDYLKRAAQSPLKSHYIFDFAINGVQGTA